MLLSKDFLMHFCFTRWLPDYRLFRGPCHFKKWSSCVFFSFFLVFCPHPTQCFELRTLSGVWAASSSRDSKRNITSTPIAADKPGQAQPWWRAAVYHHEECRRGVYCRNLEGFLSGCTSRRAFSLRPNFYIARGHKSWVLQSLFVSQRSRSFKKADRQCLQRETKSTAEPRNPIRGEV